MKARDLMTTQLHVATRDQPVMDAAVLMRDKEIGMIPVVDNRSSMNLMGVITDRDLAVRCLARRHGGDCRIRDHMTSGQLLTASADEDVEGIMDRMESAQLRRVPVVEKGRLVGIIAQADIARKIGPSDPDRVEHLLERISRAAVVPLVSERIVAGDGIIASV